ncbi:MAG: dTDP-4-dehydrorhamnose 3,5-epimerase [bacterium]|nr:dTDP-4-dehydrorhamnose 3,5-epimerase [bacterium]
MVVEPLPSLPDVLRVRLQPHGDARGFFVERWRADLADAAGLPPFVQLNHSRSSRGTLRGLHFQAPPHAQGKLVGVVRGSVFDVVVDLRRGSSSYGRWAGATLDDERHEALWVPPGFAHGFLVTSDVADVLYQVDAGYAPASEGGLAWDDPDVAIDWPLLPGARPALSAKDARWPRLADLPSPFEAVPAVR